MIRVVSSSEDGFPVVIVSLMLVSLFHRSFAGFQGLPKMQCFERSKFDYKKDRLIVMGDVCDGYPKVEKSWMGLIFQVDAKGKVTPHYLKDPEKAKREFQCLLAAANLKIHAGMARIGNG